MKRFVKRLVFGATAGPRRIRVGLLRGLSFEIDPNSKTQRLVGLDEREIESHVRRAASRARTAIDVGASDGWYTTFFASRPNIVNVLACDPEGELMEALARNVRLNDVQQKVKGHAVFVGSSGVPDSKTLDQLLADERGPFAIKIDVEGAELDVLESGVTTITNEECHLVIETHSLELERNCARWLNDRGYETAVVPNGWYRRFIPERRPLAHNRWLVARRNG